MKVLVTGVAGFIGSFTAQRLLSRGDLVVGIDNLNDYYDVKLKSDRLAQLQRREGFSFHQLDVSDSKSLHKLFDSSKPDRVIHLAAQAGVRYSLENPNAYIDSNVIGFMSVLEAVRHIGTEHLVYASTSSVYGANTRTPFSVHDGVDHPLTLYAATKRSNELMAHSYSHLFGIPTTGVRFFTVYGPWGRPDMALFTFTKKILAREPIDVFNFGKHSRDFTYIDDIVEALMRLIDNTATSNKSWDSQAPDPATSTAPYRLYNIGSSNPLDLMQYINMIEKTIGIKALKNFLPMQPGDSLDTFADVDDLLFDIGYRPETPTELGIQRFIEWYLEYYKIPSGNTHTPSR